jgi:DNA polymerase-3 subunit beta
MKFEIEKDVLQQNLNIVSRALIAKSDIVIRNVIKLTVKDNNISLYANANDEIIIQSSFTHDSLVVEEEGEILLPYGILNVLKKNDSFKITLTLGDKKNLFITSPGFKGSLVLQDINDYPTQDFLASGNIFNLDADVLKSIAREVAFSAAVTGNRPIFFGTNFSYDLETLRIVSTDSFRLSRKKLDAKVGPEAFNFTVPAKNIIELSHILEYYDGPVQGIVAGNKVVFNFGTISFQSRLQEGSYPDVLFLENSSPEFPLVLNRDELLKAIDSVSYTSEKDNQKNNYVFFHVNQNRLILSSRNREGTSTNENLVLKNEIRDINYDISLNLRYVIDAIRSFTKPEIAIEVAGPMKPLTFREIDNNNLIQVVIPIRI